MPEPVDASERSSSSARLFISYSRGDLSFARSLAQALDAAGYEVWIDLEGIRPSDDWMAAIRAAIESHDAVVFIVSPDSVDPGSVCAAELDIAVECAKRLIPIVCRSVDTRAVRVPAAIARLNWVPFLDPAEFGESLELLRSAIETDLDWVREHTRLTVRAAEWQQSGRDDSFVLQKNDLAAAEAWLQQAADRQPKPTTLQVEYVFVSRDSAQRRRRRLFAAATTALVLVTAGAAAAWWQARNAADRKLESDARAMAAEAQFERTRRLDRAIVLAHKGLRTRETPETIDAALAVAQTATDIVHLLRGHKGPVRAICLTADATHLLSSGQDGRIVLWNLALGGPAQVLTAADPERTAIACHPKAPQVAVWLGGSDLDLWQVDGSQLRRAGRVEGPDAAFALLAYSGDGGWLATSDRGSFVVRSAVDGQPRTAPVSVDDRIAALALSKDGEWVAVGTHGNDSDTQAARPGRVSLWRRGEPKPRHVQDAFDLATRQVAVGPRGDPLLAIGIEGDLTAWNLEGHRVDLKPPDAVQQRFESRAAAFDLEGRRLLTADGRKAMVISGLDEPGFQTAESLALHAMPVTAAAIDPHGRVAATADENGLVMVHRLRSPAHLSGGRRVSVDDEVVVGATFTADSRSLILRVAESRGEVDRWVPLDAGSASAAASAPAAARPAFSVEQTAHKAILRRTGTTAPAGEVAFDEGDSVLSSAVTADGRRWAAATLSGVRFLGAPAEAPIAAMLPSNFGEVTAVALRPDGRLAAVAGGDTSTALGVRFGMNTKSIVLFDTSTGRVVGLPLSGISPGDVSMLAFSPDGRYLMSLGSEAAVWVVDPRLRAEQACQALAVSLDAAAWQKLLPDVARPEGCR